MKEAGVEPDTVIYNTIIGEQTSALARLTRQQHHAPVLGVLLPHVSYTAIVAPPTPPRPLAPPPPRAHRS